MSTLVDFLRALLAPPLAVALKELRQTVRDRRVIAVLIAAPTMQLLVLGHAANLDVDRVPTVVVDLDDTTASRTALAELVADDTLREVAREHSPEAATDYLVRGDASVALIVPRGYGRALARGVPGEPARVQVLVDGTDPNRSNIAGSAASRFFASVAVETLRARLTAQRSALGGLAGLGTALSTDSTLPSASGAPVSTASSTSSAVARPVLLSLDARVLYNPRLRTAYNLIPGITGMLLLLVTTIVTSMGLARERESGTLEQVLVTPMRPWALIVGKMLPYAAIGLFDVLLALVVGTYVFDVPVRGSVLLIFGTTLVYLMTTLALGLLISTVSETQQQAFLAGIFVMMPAMLLSGVMTPIESMPSWLQPLTYVNPLRYFGEAMRAVMIRGATAEDIAPQLGALATCGLTLVTFASLRFRKTVA